MRLALLKGIMQGNVIAAVDLGVSTARVLHHAAAFARLLGTGLRILHVSPDGAADARQRVLAACLSTGPYQWDFTDDEVVIRFGRVSDAIVREARAANAAMVVMGSRGHGAVIRMLVGSTGDAVLRSATVPVLLVPPTDLDIVDIGDRVALTCGPIVAAVDLAEDSAAQLRAAGRLAALGSQPLLLMTVARSRVTDRDASQGLRERARETGPVTPRSLIVRRGSVVQEISRCASAEGAGLVVMGLRASPRSQPGKIASAVLKTRRAFVLAVPSGRAAAIEPRRWAERVALIASLFAIAAVPPTPPAVAQDSPGDIRTIVEFQRAADAYAFLHRQVEVRLQLAHRDWQETESVGTAELAAAIVARRPASAPRLFTPRVTADFRELAARAVRAPRCDPGELRTGAWEISHDVYSPATGTKPVSACITEALPRLPEELEYRTSGTVLLLVDTHANLVVDLLPALLAGSDLRDEFFKR